MFERACRTADGQMAALESGEFSQSERIKLQEHLQTCEACAARAQRISCIVTLLREDPVDLKDEQLQRILVKVSSGDSEEASSPLVAPRRLQLRWAFSIGIGLVVVILGGVLVFRGAERSRNPNPVVSTTLKERGPQRQIAALPNASWQVVLASEARAGKGQIRAGQAIETGDVLEVSAHGCALIASAHEVLILRGGRMSLHQKNKMRGDTHFRLDSGRLAIQTVGPFIREVPSLRVMAGALEIRPLGTAFSLYLADPHPPQVAVHRGRVVISSTGQRIIVSEGQGLSWGAPSSVLDPEAREALASELQHAGQLMASENDQTLSGVELRGPADATIHLDGFAAGRSSVTARLKSGAHRVTLVAAGKILSSRSFELALGEQLKIDLTQPEQVVMPSPRPLLSSEIDFSRAVQQIEKLLATGQAPQARARAQAMLRLQGARKIKATLGTLIAESYIQQKSYRSAQSAYLKVFHGNRASSQGADALYMAGSLALEQLGDVAAALGYFNQYLSKYRKGRQRQGAYLLLCKALLQDRQTQLARQTARQYVQEFPTGQFVQELKNLL